MDIKKYLLLTGLILITSFSLHSQCEVDAGEDVWICEGESVAIGGSPTIVSGGAGQTLDWSDGLGSGANPTVSPSSTTTYTVTLTTNDCDDSDQITVNVYDSPVADFSFSPNNECASTPVQFLNESTGSDLTYNWNFGNPDSPSNSSTNTHPAHDFVAYGDGTQSFTVTLTVTDENGCTDSVSETVTVNQTPDPSLTDQDVFTPFVMCGDGTTFDLTVNNASTTNPINTGYTIDWGDGTAPYSGADFSSETHTYNDLGFFDLTFTVDGTNGCSISEVYSVFVGSNPSVGLANPGSTINLCSPSILNFPITNWENNPPGTTYVVNYNDGSPSETYDHPPPLEIIHDFVTSSCGSVSLSGYDNSYHVQIVAQNPCGFSAATIEPIQTSSAPTAAMDVFPMNEGCVNSPFTFSNVSTGSNFNNGGVCTSLMTATWSIEPAVGWTVTGGSLTDPDSFSAEFSIPGTYTITMQGANPCGDDEVSMDVCVVPLPDALFTIDDPSGCAPLVVNTENFSTSLDLCDNEVYTWTVFPTTGWFISNGSSSSVAPEFTFTQEGSYTIEMEVENACGSDFFTEVVNVIEPPTVDMTTFNDLCEGGSIDPSAIYDDGGGTISVYDWDFTGGLPASSSDPNPGVIDFNDEGDFVVSISVTNECGTATDSDAFSVVPIPNVSIIEGGNLTICENECVGLTAIGADSYTWDFSFDLSTTSGSNTTACPGSSNTYQVTGINGTGCSDVASITVDVIPSPIVTSPNAYDWCIGACEQLSIDVSSGSGTYSTYQWSPDSFLDDASIPNPQSCADTDINYTVSVTDDLGCTGSLNVFVDVHPLPSVYAGPDIDVCNQPVDEQLTGFTPALGTGISTEWTGDNVTLDGIFTPTTDVLDYTLTYTFVDDNGCVNSDDMVVSVIEPVVAAGGPDFNVCLNSGSFNMEPVTIGGSWSGSVHVTSGGVFNPTEAGVFVLDYSIGSGSCVSGDQVTVEVYELPNVTLIDDQFICAGDSVELTSVVTDGLTPYTSYSWTGDLASISTPDQPNTYVLPNGDQWYTLTVTDSHSCVGSDDVFVDVLESPIVEAGPPLELCNQPLDVTLTGFSPIAGAGELGEWSGNNVSVDGIYTPSGPVSEYIYYTFENVAGCSGIDSLLVTVVEPTVAEAGPPQEVCLNNGPYQLIDFAPVLGVTWSGDGIIDPVNGVFDPTIVGAPSTTELLMEFGSGSCYTSDVVEITVLELPTIDVVGDFSFCGNADAEALDPFTPFGGTWEGPGITDDALGIFDPSIGEGMYDLIYWYIDPISGCSDTANQVVNVSPIPLVDFSIDPLNCTDGIVGVINSSVDATEFVWTWGNGDQSFEENPAYIFPDEGFFDVELLVTNEFGCSDSLTLNTEVIDPPTPDFVLNPEEGCAPLEVSFENLSEGQYLSYEWDLSTAVSDQFEPDPIIYQQGDEVVEYPISLIVTNYCGSYEALDTVVVLPQPIAEFGTDLNQFCTPWTVNINNTSVGLPDTFLWDFGDGTTSDLEDPLTHIYYTDSLPTDYTIGLYIENECGVDSFFYTITVLPNDVLAFFNTDLTEGCGPLEVNFTDFSEGGTVIAYDFGDDEITNDPDPTHTYSEPGVYTVYQYVNNGCSFDTAQVMIEVFEVPELGFTTDVPETCANSAIQFINLSEDVNNVEWDFGDGEISDMTNPLHTYELGGDYLVTITGTSMFNECEAELQQWVSINDTPSASFSIASQVGCSPFEVDFNNTSGGGLFFSWDFGNGETGSSEDETATYYNGTADPVQYTATLIVENLELCADTFIMDIVVSPTPVAEFVLSEVESCDNPITIQTTNNSTYSDDFEWSFGPFGDSDLFEPEVEIFNVGTYNFTLTASNAYGCSHNQTQQFTIHPMPEAEFNAIPSSGCIDLNVAFNNFSTESITYIWDFGDGETSGSLAPTHEYDQYGTYDVSLIAISDQGCSDTLVYEEYINAYPLPVANFTILEEDYSIYSPVVDFIDQSIDPDAWYWNFGDGHNGYVQHPSHTYSQAGTYLIDLTVVNEFGCSDRDEMEVTIDDEFNFYVPNSFTPDGDLINDVFQPYLVGKGLIEFYSFKIFDRWGHMVFETNDPDEPWLGDFKGNGDYYVQDDVYLWQAKIRLKGAETSRFVEGHVTILR